MRGSLARGLYLLASLATYLGGASADDLRLVDGAGRSVTITDGSRIASVGGDVTEILYALGAASRIVAVDATSLSPPDALKHKPNLGYMRALATEGVLSTGATLILANEQSGPPEVVRALQGSSIPYVVIKQDFTPAGVAAKAILIARAIGEESKGEALAKGIEATFAQLAADRARITSKRRGIVVIGVQSGRALVGGKETSAQAILDLAGVENAAASLTGFKPVGGEAIVEMAPDVVVVMERSSGVSTKQQLLAIDGVALSPAGRQGRIFEMDGLYLLGFGPRTPEAARDLMSSVYPGLTPSAVR